MYRAIRPISWIKAARKDFEGFPQGACPLWRKAECQTPQSRFQGFGSGVLELALRHRKNALRVVYALHIGADIWVIHAFQKKSKAGIKTPQPEIDLIDERLKRLKETLR